MALDKVVASSLLLQQYVEILSTLTVLFLSYELYSILTSQRPYPNILLVGAEGGNGESKKRYSADGVGVVKRAMKQVRVVTLRRCVPLVKLTPCSVQRCLPNNHRQRTKNPPPARLP